MFIELYRQHLNAIFIEAMQMCCPFKYCKIDLSLCLNLLGKTYLEETQTLSFRNTQAARKMSLNVQGSVSRSPAVKILLSYIGTGI